MSQPRLPSWDCKELTKGKSSASSPLCKNSHISSILEVQVGPREGLCERTEQFASVPDPPAGHHHEDLTLPTQAVFQQPRQLAVAVGDVSSLLLQRLEDAQSTPMSEALDGVFATKLQPLGQELNYCERQSRVHRTLSLCILAE